MVWEKDAKDTTLPLRRLAGLADGVKQFFDATFISTALEKRSEFHPTVLPELGRGGWRPGGAERGDNGGSGDVCFQHSGGPPNEYGRILLRLLGQ
eukprot:5974591-Pyramimonas_sp.AAC.1